MAQQVNVTGSFGYAAPCPTNDTNVMLYLGTDINNMMILSKIAIYYQAQCFSFFNATKITIFDFDFRY